MNYDLRQKLIRFGAVFDEDSNSFVLNENGYEADMGNEQARGLVLALEIQYATKNGHNAPWPE